MRVHFLFLVLIFCISEQVKAQSIKEDSLLLKVVEELPDGWTARIADSLFIVEYSDSIWTANGNWINAHIDHYALKNDSTWIKTYGKKTTMIFEFELRSKMEKESLDELIKSDKTYQGRWAWSIYNSQSFTLFQRLKPTMDDEYNALWPKDTGVWQVNSLFSKYLSLGL